MASAGPSPNSDVSNVDGSVDFSAGVNSLKVTTIQSEQNPNGLARNELAWLTNGSVRDGGITPRGGWKTTKKLGSGTGSYQGGFLYQPIDGSDPYLLFLMGGRMFKAGVDDQDVQDLFSTAYVQNPNNKASITLKNLSLPTGFGSILVPADMQSIYGLPAFFNAPAVGSNINFSNLTSNPGGSVGDVLLFYASMTCTALTITYDGGRNVWKADATMKADQPNVVGGGTPIIGSAFGNPHGVPAANQISNLTTWGTLQFVFPNFGDSVAVEWVTPADLHLPTGTYIIQDASHSYIISLSNNQQVFSYDSGTNIITNTVSAHSFILRDSNGNIVNNICGKPVVNLNTGHVGETITPVALLKLDCTPVPAWSTPPPFTVNSFGQFHLVLTQPATVPDGLFPDGAFAVGQIANFLYGAAQITNIKKISAFDFGSGLDKPFFVQGNEFCVIQAGDYTTLPLFWDGTTLRQSIGINDNAVAPGTPGVNELPAGGPMDFYMGRLWYAQGTSFSAGDITGGPSGTAPYNFRDAILNVTENPLVLGGDGFATPANEGSITALKHNANQDAALGQGILFAFTPRGAHGLTVPVTRTDWISANNQNQPKIVPVQLAMGTLSDRSVVTVNGDLFYQDPLGNIRTLLTAVRYFGQWGNLPISSNINRLLQFNDKTLLSWGCGIYFNNRMIQSALPVQTQQGVVHQALSALDFEPISNFNAQSVPVWEGMYEGLDILQTFTGVFSGKERAFAVVVSRIDFSIQLWELTADDRFDNANNRIQMQAEFPAFTWGNEFSMKQQIGAELWIDRLFGEVVFTLEYRPDGESCWQKWHEWKVCSPRNSCENTGVNPCTGLQQVQCYPLIPYGESYRQTMSLPTPPQSCSSAAGRPSYINYQCQPRLTVKGFCRVRGFLLHSAPRERKLYEGKIC
jgi:hypothetical protein